MRARIEPTEDLLRRLCEAQADHTAEILKHHAFADDMGDYTNSALDTMRALFNMCWDQVDLPALDAYLNTPQSKAEANGMINLPQSGGLHTHLGFNACDGICEALYDLNPIALDDELDAPDDQAHRNH